MRNARLAQLDRALASGAKGQSGRWPKFDKPHKCPNCRKPVLVGLTDAGRRVLMSPRPDPWGAFLLPGGSSGPVPVVRRLRRGEQFPVFSLRFADHAATCPGGR